ncbi:MAG: hypothetical protein AB3N18_11170 [Allomuricauda sp.]
MKQQFYYSKKNLSILVKKLLNVGYNQLPDIPESPDLAEEIIIIDTEMKNFWYTKNDMLEFHIRLIANTHQQVLKPLKGHFQEIIK